MRDTHRGRHTFQWIHLHKGDQEGVNLRQMRYIYIYLLFINIYIINRFLYEYFMFKNTIFEYIHNVRTHMLHARPHAVVAHVHYLYLYTL